MRTGRILLGMAAAALAGTALGILIAPDKGVNTREKLMRKGKDIVNDANEKYQDIVDKMDKKMEDLKQESARIKAEWTAKTEQVVAEMNGHDKVNMN